VTVHCNKHDDVLDIVHNLRPRNPQHVTEWICLRCRGGGEGQTTPMSPLERASLCLGCSAQD